MRELPGRKALLLISDRLRDPARESHAAASRITTLAHRASAVLFAVDMGNAPEQPFLLEQGLAGAARDTGGRSWTAVMWRGFSTASRSSRHRYYVLTYAPRACRSISSPGRLVYREWR